MEMKRNIESKWKRKGKSGKWNLRQSGSRDLFSAKVENLNGTLCIRVKHKLNVNEIVVVRIWFIAIFHRIISHLNKSYRFFAYVDQALQRFGWLIGLWRRIWKLQQFNHNKLFPI